MVCCAMLPLAPRAQAQNTFTYQGRLTEGGQPASGSYDFEFQIWNALTAGAQVGPTITNAPVAVSNGVFTVALDFGAGVFDGGSRWLALAVRNASTQNPFAGLSPRQPVTAAPYALYALTPAGAAGATGAMGATGARGLTFRGGWSGATAYVTDAAVIFNGSAWLAKRGNTNAAPVEGADWTLLTQKGDVGATGPQGVPGTTTASGLTSGTLEDARLSPNVAFLNGTNVFAGTNRFSGIARLTNVNNQLVGAFTGSGAGLTAVPAASLTGTLDMARVANVSVTDAMIAGVAAGKVTGTIGNAQLASGIDAAKLTTGLLQDARLSGAIARLTDVTSSVSTASNALSGRLIGTNDALVTLLNSLSAQVVTLTASLTTLSNRTESNILSAATFVSADPADSLLLARGLRGVVTTPAPAWANATATDAPTARSAHSAVWTGQEMVVWGGTLGAGVYSSVGARYQPELDAWTAVSTVSAPAARSGHSAVWTGQEMVVWGGFSGSSYLNTGGRFAVSNQLWSAVTPTGAPAARDGHAAIWTGSRMVIWGGRNSTGMLVEGALYTPSNNTWTALSLPNAPAPRAAASAVWTGDRLLVWGGDGTNDYLNTGAQLLFTNGVPSEWRTNNLTGAPSARSGHTAVWTGSRMLVWGGSRSGNYLGDGAAYDPVADAWTALTTTNAPVARTLHNAVWTGSEMVVFGGETASGTVATGGAYDPVKDQWRVLGNPGSPQARSEATAVWTGSEVLFFGGRNNGSPLAALQRLTPQPTWYFYRKP